MSPEAATDIKNVLDYTLERFGPAKHAEYQTLIELALADIRNRPKSFPAKAKLDLRTNLFTLHIGRRGKRASHLFLYIVRDDNFVEICRLLHEGMDLVQHIPQ